MHVCIQQEKAEVDLTTLTGRGGSCMTLCICKDLGLDCSYEVIGTSTNEIMRKFIDHAESAHHMDVLTADIIFRIQKAIKK
jgi:predicted small metal-binding protein